MSNAQKLSQAVAGGADPVKTNVTQTWTAQQTFNDTTYIQPPGVNPTYGSALTPSVAWSKVSWSAESTTSSATYTGLTIGQLYQIDWSTTSGSYAFNVTLDGSVTLANAQWWGNKSVTFTATATSHTINLVPTSAITAVITTPTLKSVATKGGAVAVGIKDAEGSVASQIRSFNDTLYCTAIGTNALLSNTTGYYNSAIGTSALQANTTGYSNSAIGTSALYANTTGYNNSAIGTNALQSNTTGFHNSAIGLSALYSNTTGYNNSAIGTSALYSNTTGAGNSAIGINALQSNATGYNNSAFGVNAGRYYGSGTSAATTCNNSVYLGYDTRASADGNTNETVIGASAIGNGSNTTTIGNSSVTSTIIPAGNLVLSSGQIKFPATQNASADANTLDDYEEGTFTPVVRDAAAGNAATAGSANGYYTKIGNVVHFRIRIININTTGLTAGNRVFVTGFPFTSANLTGNEAILPVYVESATPTTGCVLANIGANATVAGLSNAVTTGYAAFTVSQLTSTTADVYFSGSYTTA